jgi:hypothetical protein
VTFFGAAACPSSPTSFFGSLNSKNKIKKIQAKENSFPRRAKHSEQFWRCSSLFWWGGAQKSRETLILISRDVYFTAEFRAVNKQSRCA